MAEVKSKETNSEVEAPKKRGRKPKAVVEEVKNVEVEAPKKRGRKPKAVVEETKVPVEEEQTTEHVHDDKTSDDVHRETLRSLVASFYDVQKLRIATGNRIVASLNIKMGQAPQTKQTDEMDKEAQKTVAKFRKEYSRITDAYVEGSSVDKVGSSTKNLTKNVSKRNKMIDDIIKDLRSGDNPQLELIQDKLDYDFITVYMNLLKQEEEINKLIADEVKKHRMWDAFFKDVRGCGPLMAAVCISYFDIHKARHVSSLWKYAGLDVVAVDDGEDEDGIPKYRYEGRAKWHTEMVEYTDKDGAVKEKKSITYNPKLKTKLVGVLGDCFLKQGDKYRKIYDYARNRYENRPDLKDASKIRIHKMAVRYMIKMFLADMWVVWRGLEGYEIEEPYAVAKLGLKPHGWNEAFDA